MRIILPSSISIYGLIRFKGIPVSQFVWINLHSQFMIWYIFRILFNLQHVNLFYTSMAECFMIKLATYKPLIVTYKIIFDKLYPVPYFGEIMLTKMFSWHKVICDHIWKGNGKSNLYYAPPPNKKSN